MKSYSQKEGEFDSPSFMQYDAIQSNFYSRLDKEKKLVFDSLRKDGIAIVRNFISKDLIDAVIEDCNGKYTKKKKHLNEERRVTSGYKFSENIKKIASDQRIINLLSEVYGRKAFPFATLNFEIGTEQAAHSDVIHFGSKPNGFLAGVWVALENVNDNNGPLFYYPKSHLLPTLDLDAFNIKCAFDDSDPYRYYELYEKKMKDYIYHIKLERMTANDLKKGDIVIWSANLIHGGSKIINKNLTRKSQVTHYFFNDCFYYAPITSRPLEGKISSMVTFNVSKDSRVFSNFKSVPVSLLSRFTLIFNRFIGLIKKGLNRSIEK